MFKEDNDLLEEKIIHHSLEAYRLNKDNINSYINRLLNTLKRNNRKVKNSLEYIEEQISNIKTIEDNKTNKLNTRRVKNINFNNLFKSSLLVYNKNYLDTDLLNKIKNDFIDKEYIKFFNDLFKDINSIYNNILSNIGKSNANNIHNNLVKDILKINDRIKSKVNDNKNIVKTLDLNVEKTIPWLYIKDKALVTEIIFYPFKTVLPETKFNNISDKVYDYNLIISIKPRFKTILNIKETKVEENEINFDIYKIINDLELYLKDIEKNKNDINNIINNNIRIILDIKRKLEKVNNDKIDDKDQALISTLKYLIKLNIDLMLNLTQIFNQKYSKSLLLYRNIKKLIK